MNEMKERKKERKKGRKVRSLMFFVIFKERKNSSEKERKKESCDLWFATSKEEGKERSGQEAGWCHNRMVA